MTRLAIKPVAIPKGVEVKVLGDKISVKGPKGTITKALKLGIKLEIKGEVIIFTKDGDGGMHDALHGLYIATVAWMIEGVTKGFSKELELVGVGYRAALQGKKLALSLGFSHPIELDPPAGITFAVQGANKIMISGIDKNLVGETAAKVRSIRQVEPYKGKGVRYVGEIVRKKAGKAAKVGGGAGG